MTSYETGTTVPIFIVGITKLGLAAARTIIELGGTIGAIIDILPDDDSRNAYDMNVIQHFMTHTESNFNSSFKLRLLGDATATEGVPYFACKFSELRTTNTLATGNYLYLDTITTDHTTLSTNYSSDRVVATRIECSDDATAVTNNNFRRFVPGMWGIPYSSAYAHIGIPSLTECAILPVLDIVRNCTTGLTSNTIVNVTAYEEDDEAGHVFGGKCNNPRSQMSCLPKHNTFYIRDAALNYANYYLTHQTTSPINGNMALSGTMYVMSTKASVAHITITPEANAAGVKTALNNATYAGPLTPYKFHPSSTIPARIQPDDFVKKNNELTHVYETKILTDEAKGYYSVDVCYSFAAYVKRIVFFMSYIAATNWGSNVLVAST